MLALRARDEATRTLATVDAVLNRLVAHSTSARSSLDGMGGSLKAVGVVGAAATAAVVGYFGAAEAAATHYQDSLANIQVTAGLTDTTTRLMGTAIEQAALGTTSSAQDMADALAPVAGELGKVAGGYLDAATASQVLKAAQDLHESSNVSLAGAMQTVTDLLVAYNLKATDAAKVSDLLFQAHSQLGMGVDSLGMMLERLKPRLAGSGIDLRTLLGIVDQMQPIAGKGARGMMMVVSVLQMLQSPSKAAQTLFDKLGIATRDANGQFLGVPQVLDNIRNGLDKLKSSGDRTTAMTMIFGRQVGIGSALVQAGSAGIASYAASLDKMGTAQDAAAKRGQDLAEQGAALDAAFKTVQDAIGMVLIPTTVRLMSTITPILTGIAQWVVANPQLAVTIMTVVAAVGALAAGFAFLPVILTAIGGGIGFLLSGPFLLFLTAIGTGIVLVTQFADRFGPVFDAVSKFSSLLGVIGGALLDFVTSGFQLNRLFTSIQTGLNLTTGTITDLPSLMAAVAPRLAGAIGDIITAVGDLGGRFLAWVETQIPPLTAALSRLLRALVDWGAKTIPAALRQILPILLGLGTQALAWLQTNLPRLVATVVSLGERAITTLGPVVLGWATTVFDTLAPIVVGVVGQWAGAFVDWVATSLPGLRSALGDVVAAIVDWVTTQVPVIVDEVATWVAPFIGWVAASLPVLLDDLNTLWDNIVAWVSDQVPNIEVQVGAWVDAFASWVPGAIIAFGDFAGRALHAFADFATNVADYIASTVLPTLISGVETLATTLVGWVVPRIPTFLAGLAALAAALSLWVAQQIPYLAGDALNLGANIITGVGKGLLAHPEAIAEALGTLLMGAVVLNVIQKAAAWAAEKYLAAQVLASGLLGIVSDAWNGLVGRVSTIATTAALNVAEYLADLNLGERLGSVLSDAWQLAAGAAGGALNAAGQATASAVSGWGGAIGDALGNAWGVAQNAAGNFIGQAAIEHSRIYAALDRWTTALDHAIADAWDAITTPIAAIVKAAAEHMGVYAAALKAKALITDALSTLWQTITGGAEVAVAGAADGTLWGEAYSGSVMVSVISGTEDAVIASGAAAGATAATAGAADGTLFGDAYAGAAEVTSMAAGPGIIAQLTGFLTGGSVISSLGAALTAGLGAAAAMVVAPVVMFDVIPRLVNAPAATGIEKQAQMGNIPAMDAATFFPASLQADIAAKAQQTGNDAGTQAAQSLVNGYSNTLQDNMGPVTNASNLMAQIEAHSLAEHQDETANAAAALAQKVPAAITKSAADAAAIAGKIPSQIADSITSNQDAITSGMADLQANINKPIDEAARIAALQGQLTSKTLADGLASNDPLIHEKAMALRDTIETQMQLLEGAANSYGSGTGNAFAQGLEGSQIAIDHAAAVALAGAKHRMAAYSAPPDPTAPLHDVVLWAHNTMEAYAVGLEDWQQRVADAASKAISGAAPIIAGTKPATAQGARAFAVGTASVPGTGLAVLHKGEMIIPATVSATLRQMLGLTDTDQPFPAQVGNLMVRGLGLAGAFGGLAQRAAYQTGTTSVDLARFGETPTTTTSASGTSSSSGTLSLSGILASVHHHVQRAHHHAKQAHHHALHARHHATRAHHHAAATHTRTAAATAAGMPTEASLPTLQVLRNIGGGFTDIWANLPGMAGSSAGSTSAGLPSAAPTGTNLAAAVSALGSATAAAGVPSVTVQVFLGTTELKDFVTKTLFAEERQYAGAAYAGSGF